MKKVIVGNWKLYVESLEEAVALVRAAKSARGEVILCVPHPFIPILVRTAGKAVKIGAQDVSIVEGGAHTGEVSARVLKSAGATHALVGHSERRERGESETLIAEKMARAIDAKLVPVLCIGERERDAAGNHFGVIEAQLRSAFAKIGKKKPPLMVAYEPVWAIGKRLEDAMKPPELQETVIFIRKVLASLFGRSAALSTPVLYGGSVDAVNAERLLREGGVQGFLPGRASAERKELKALCKVVFS